MLSTSVTTLSNHELLAEAARLANLERHATAQLIALLAEVDSRGLYLAEGYSSMFAYCTQVLRLSESAAYDRIEAARASRRLPLVLQRLMDGAVTLTTVRLLAPHLTADNCESLLEAAGQKSKREVLHLVGCLAPQPDVPPSVRRLPSSQPTKTTPADGQPLLHVKDEPRPTLPTPAPAPRATVAPLSPERYLIKVTVGRETRLAKTGRPRSNAVSAANTRRVPANVKRVVWERDGGQCAFVGTQGRCTETGYLEFHHRVPYAAGGVTSVDNLALRCRSHNIHEAVQHFGATRAGTSSFKAGELVNT